MPVPYNVSELAVNPSLVHYLVVFNNWSDGLLFILLVFAPVLIAFFALQRVNKDVPDTNALAASVFGTFLSGVLFLIQFQGERLIGSGLFSIFLGTTIIILFLRIVKDFLRS